MSLQIFKTELELLDGPVQTFHEGFAGGSYVSNILIKNTYVEYFYENISLKVTMKNDLVEGDVFSQSGWSIKLSNSSAEPTEKEWGEIRVNEQVMLGNLGTAEEADTETMIPVWVRVFCPGHSRPEIKKNMSLSLKYSKRLVGENV